MAKLPQVACRLLQLSELDSLQLCFWSKRKTSRIKIKSNDDFWSNTSLMSPAWPEFQVKMYLIYLAINSIKDTGWSICGPGVFGVSQCSYLLGQRTKLIDDKRVLQPLYWEIFPHGWHNNAILEWKFSCLRRWRFVRMLDIRLWWQCHAITRTVNERESSPESVSTFHPCASPRALISGKKGGGRLPGKDWQFGKRLLCFPSGASLKWDSYSRTATRVV